MTQALDDVIDPTGSLKLVVLVLAEGFRAEFGFADNGTDMSDQGPPRPRSLRTVESHAAAGSKSMQHIEIRS